MPGQRDPKTSQALEDLLRSNGLSGKTRLYRCTRPEFLAPGEAPGRLSMSANDASPEAVVDIYGNGYILVAEHLGPGLAFAEQRDNQWRAPDRKLVEILIEDVLAQGGLLYPVESVITEKVWFATLPRGSISVREVGA